jgi:ribosomal protein S18 acetylase RimI-like enzyme
MPSVEIRPATQEDIEFLMHLDHSYETEFVWQMERELSEDKMFTAFHEVHLPRKIKIEYPHSVENLTHGISTHNLLVAVFSEKLVGYIRIEEDNTSKSVRIPDLMVDNKLRHNGIGTALIMSVEKWARQKKYKKMVIEIQSKNYPASLFVKRCGFQFSGFHDHHYPNQDIVLFFDSIER